MLDQGVLESSFASYSRKLGNGPRSEALGSPVRRLKSAVGSRAKGHPRTSIQGRSRKSIFPFKNKGLQLSIHYEVLR
jgi:hypothetical protein